MQVITEFLSEIEKELSFFKITLDRDLGLPNFYVLHINGHTSGIRNKYPYLLETDQKPWDILSKIDKEILNNISLPIDHEIKKNYLTRLIETLKSIDDNIIQEGTEYSAKNIFYENCSKSDLKEHLKGLSDYFKEIKMSLREKITKTDLNLKKVLASETSALSEINDKNSLSKNETNSNGMLFRKIRFLDDKNLLVTLFFDLLDKGFISTTKANLERFILASFSDENGEAFSKDTVQTILKSGREEKRAKSDKRFIVPDK
jgi:hypothetical protein